MKKKILSFLLSASLLAAAVVPASPVTAQGTEEDNGMHISKTATANGDGTYTISLEAYATGEKVISEVSEDVPTDIVLVLDQSGSMATRDFSNGFTYKQYSSRQDNSDLYNSRNNLWYKLEDDTYVKVSLQREATYTYSDYSGQTNRTYYNNQNNLYLKTPDGQYKKVTVERSGYISYTYTYTYTFDGGSVVSSGRNNRPNFSSYGTLVRGTVDDYKYTYSYVLNGENLVIESSQGENTFPSKTYYYQQATSTTTRLQALKDALNSFVSSVNTKAAGEDGTLGTDDDVKHRIAVVGFAYGSEGYGNDSSYTNSEVFIGSTQYRYNSRYNSAQSQYGNAFQNMNTQQGQNNVTSSIGVLDANGATYVDVGMKMASGILNANPVDPEEKRNRVVIVFTDGAPGWSGYESDVADDAITEAQSIKDSGATVYTVGIFSGADATTPGNEYGNDTAKSNWFMQNLSSNNGTVQDPSYYMAASDTDALNSIFEQISDDIEQGGTSSTLDETAVVKDTISRYFTLPAGANADDIILETYRCTGKKGDEYTWEKNSTTMGATATVDGKNVSVTGFDFSENYIAEIKEDGEVTGYQGHKLVITFKVVPEDGFLGGNNVPTNDGAYIYENASSEDPLLTFNVPEVNVPIENVTVTAQDKNVYLLGSLSEGDVLDGATAQVGDIELQLGEDGYGLESWQYEFVDITPTINVQDYNNLTKDEDYSLTVTVSPKTDGNGADGTPATSTSSSPCTAKINVFKPEITWQDSQINSGDTPDYKNQNFAGVEWKHGTTVANNMIGEEPELTYEYTPAENAFSTEQKVNVTVKIKGTDITAEHVTFGHKDCNFTGCTFDPAECEFIVHIKSFDLTIKKTGCNEKIDENQTFIFNVTGPNDYSTQVVIPGNGSVTIKGLPAGEYTITEDTSWSWRYEPTTNPQTVTTDKVVNGTATVTFNNTRDNEKWLDGNAYARNLFDGSND